MLYNSNEPIPQEEYVVDNPDSDFSPPEYFDPYEDSHNPTISVTNRLTPEYEEAGTSDYDNVFIDTSACSADSTSHAPTSHEDSEDFYTQSLNYSDSTDYSTFSFDNYNKPHHNQLDTPSRGTSPSDTDQPAPSTNIGEGAAGDDRVWWEENREHSAVVWEWFKQCKKCQQAVGLGEGTSLHAFYQHQQGARCVSLEKKQKEEKTQTRLTDLFKPRPTKSALPPPSLTITSNLSLEPSTSSSPALWSLSPGLEPGLFDHMRRREGMARREERGDNGMGRWDGRMGWWDGGMGWDGMGWDGMGRERWDEGGEGEVG
ncbi:hypothetical protein JAAARDRAFT_197110 [Jaapia argillacea MUCL 33604]|uniref:Uncharacterized protein n=1 Tax=Jaapia argillacea MUCL 33604 TaxID=933084 RepID=A0A067PJJ7_9AGAM|nr:hypothetical protein JAAARDRAFT_197110 [Jaapia argillacea MUCL 33604]